MLVFMFRVKVLSVSPVWARGRCRISPPRFLAECWKRQLNQVSLVLLYFSLSAFSDLCWVCLSVFSCTVFFVSISQVIGCENRLRNDLYCVGWGVKLYSNQAKYHDDIMFVIICTFLCLKCGKPFVNNFCHLWLIHKHDRESKTDGHAYNCYA